MGQGGQVPSPRFWQISYPYLNQGADYAHQITMCPTTPQFFRPPGSSAPMLSVRKKRAGPAEGIIILFGTVVTQVCIKLVYKPHLRTFFFICSAVSLARENFFFYFCSKHFYKKLINIKLEKEQFLCQNMLNKQLYIKLG